MKPAILLLSCCVGLLACGTAEVPNTSRQGIVALSTADAWNRLQDEWPEAMDYRLCETVNEPCSPMSAYVRERSEGYWFALHRVAAPCDGGGACEPDLFQYFAVDELGTVSVNGSAVIEYGADGAIRQIIGEPIWNMPELDQPKQPLLNIQSEQESR